MPTQSSVKTPKVTLLKKTSFPLMPPELRAKKSVIIPGVEDVIWEYNDEGIMAEIETRNTWIRDELESVYKFPNTQTLKLTFTQTSYPKKCSETGIKAFAISIPAHIIRTETFIPIKCRVRC